MMNERARSRSRSRAASRIMPGAGLRRGLSTIRRVRTMVNGVDQVVAAELADEFGLHALEIGFGEIAAPDAALVGDDHEPVAALAQTAQLPGGAGIDLHLRRRVTVIGVDHQSAVAVEENRREFAGVAQAQSDTVGRWGNAIFCRYPINAPTVLKSSVILSGVYFGRRRTFQPRIAVERWKVLRTALVPRSAQDDRSSFGSAVGHQTNVRSKLATNSAAVSVAVPSLPTTTLPAWLRDLRRLSRRRPRRQRQRKQRNRRVARAGNVEHLPRLARRDRLRRLPPPEQRHAVFAQGDEQHLGVPFLQQPSRRPRRETGFRRSGRWPPTADNPPRETPPRGWA